MYKQILIKDLKRKKTMNVILLVFITLSAMFMASSGNNLVSITSATDKYIEKAGVADYIIMTMSEHENDEMIKKFLKNSDNVSSWASDELIYVSSENIMRENSEKLLAGNGNTLFFATVSTKQQKFFDDKNNQIMKIREGEIYVPQKFLEYADIDIGDKVIYEIENLKKEFIIAGITKDAVMGSGMMGAIRILISEFEFEEIVNSVNIETALLYSIDTHDVNKFTLEINRENFSRIADITMSIIKISYIMDTILAIVMLVVSMCLIIIAVVVLRFTVSFTMSEEFREIGIMKAIGISQRKIRGIYIVKYFAISVVGSILGYVGSIPLSKLLIGEVSANILIEKTELSSKIGIIAVILMVGIVMMFCYSSTKIVKKYSAIDAIRNGTTGERFNKKGFIRMSKSPVSSVTFMAVNDILSNIKRFSTMIITFILGIVIIMIPLNTLNTLKSDNLLYWFGFAPCDYFLANESRVLSSMNSGRDYIEETIDDIEKRLENEGIKANAFQQIMLKSRITHKDKMLSIDSYQYTGTNLDKNVFIEGSAPQNANEIAISFLTADTLGVKIGDKVKLMIGNKEDTFIITATFQSMMNQGSGIFLSEKYEVDYKYSTGVMSMQLAFENGGKYNKDQLEKIFTEYEIQKPGEYINNLIGDFSEMIRGPQIAITVLVVLMNMLVVVLMTKSFIIKEKGEIGLLKSIGFTDKAVISWQMIRVGIILFVSITLGILLSDPLGQITSGLAFKMMGAKNIVFEVNYMEVYFFYPMIIFISTMAASFLAVLSVRKIKPRDTKNIE